jgi:hypothetical protein
MPRNVFKPSPWDSKLNQLLISHYQALVLTEMNDPIPLTSSFLGIRRSNEIAEQVATSQQIIPSVGSFGVFDDGIPFYHMHMQTLSKDDQKRLKENG